MLEKRDIIKSAEEKFLDYLKKQEDKFTITITEFTMREFYKMDLSIDNNELEGSRAATEAYNYNVRLPIHELSYIRRVTPVLESIILNKTNLESEMITDDFDHLSIYLLTSQLKGIEALNILMDFVSLNINKGLLKQPKDAVILDPLIAQEKGLDLKTLSKLSLDGKLNGLLNASDSELSDEDSKLKFILLESVKESMQSKGFRQFLSCHQTLKDSYLNKVDSYSKEDIDKIIESLDGLDVCLPLCQKIRATLNRGLSKRVKKDSMKSYVVKKSQSSGESKYISDTEYKQIKKEIAKYCDTYKMEAKKNLTEEERLYCAHLLLKIGTDSGLVKAFFDRTEEQPNLENPIGFYNHTYDKFKFYEQKCDFQHSLNNIQEYLQEIFITNSEDYQFWKNEIRNELETMIPRVPKSYEYEIKKASAYCKTK